MRKLSAQTVTVNVGPIARSVGNCPMSGLIPWAEHQPQSWSGIRDPKGRAFGILESLDDCPVDSRTSSKHIVWNSKPIASSMTPWPARQPQTWASLLDLQIRPAGTAMKLIDCPIRSRTTSGWDQVFLASVETSSNEFSSSGSHSTESSETWSLSSSSRSNSSDDPVLRKKLINIRIDPKHSLLRSPPSSPQGSSSRSTAPDDNMLRDVDECNRNDHLHSLWCSPWSSADGSSLCHANDDAALHRVDEGNMSLTAASATGTKFGKSEDALNPEESNSGCTFNGGQDCTHAQQAQTQTHKDPQGARFEQSPRLAPCDSKDLQTSIGRPPRVPLPGRKGCTDKVMFGSRLCKHVGKRQQMRPNPDICMHAVRCWERLKSQIEERPDTFDVETVELPPSISSDERLKEKLMRRMRRHQKLVKSHDSDQSASIPTLISL